MYEIRINVQIIIQIVDQYRKHLRSRQDNKVILLIIMWHIFDNLHDVENFLKKITKVISEEKIKIMDTSKIKSLKY